MNDTARRIIEDRMRRGDRRRDRDYGDYPMDRRGDYRGGDMRNDYRGGNMRNDYRGGDMRNDYRGGDMRNDYRGGDMRNDYRSDYGDDGYYGEKNEMKLSKSDLKRWKRMLKNSDGTMGEHFNADQFREAARQIGAKFDKYDEMELCMTANMLYSDLGEALRPIIPKDKEAVLYAKMAKLWLEDEDGPEGSEKLALYFCCIVDDDED